MRIMNNRSVIVGVAVIAIVIIAAVLVRKSPAGSPAGSSAGSPVGSPAGSTVGLTVGSTADSEGTNAYRTCRKVVYSAPPICQANKSDWPTGHACGYGPNCASGACGRAEAGASSLTCCSSASKGKTDLYAGYEYCTGMPTGAVCWSDAMCANGSCVGNDGGFKRGTCN